METRSTAKRNASIESYGILTRNQKQKLGVSLPTFQETNITSKRRRKTVVETEQEEPTNYLDILPDVPLRMVFKHLQVEDIINTYSVSPRMMEIANEEGTWKDKYLTISELGKLMEYVKIFQACPLLRGIDISLSVSGESDQKDLIEQAHNLIVQEIIKNAQDLFYIKAGNLGLGHIGLLVERFPNLEKLHITIPLPQIVDFLQVLQPCLKLKELHINYKFIIFDIKICDFLRQAVTKLLGDSFPVLSNLNLSYLQNILETTDTVYILEKKRFNLRNLEILWDEKISPQVLDIISQCRNLNLVLNVHNINEMCLDRLRLLRSVEIYFLDPKDSFLSDLLSGISLPNVKALKIVFRCDSHGNTGKDILRKVIIKFPKLQKLFLSNVTYKDIDDQLSMIGNLTDLQSLSLFNIKFLTDRGISHLSKCNLKQLRVANFPQNLWEVLWEV